MTSEQLVDRIRELEAANSLLAMLLEREQYELACLRAKMADMWATHIVVEGVCVP